MDEHAKQEKVSPEIQEETEFRLRSRSMPLPLSWEEVHEFSDFLHKEDGRLCYKKLTDAEKEWAEFLLKKAFDYAQRRQEWYEGLEPLQDEHPDNIALKAALYAAREQITCAIFLAERARTALYVQKFLGGGEAPEELQKRYAENEAALAHEKAENDRLRARVAELEHVRQDLQDLKSVHGEGPKLRTMWRYVLELEARGMTDADIRNALKGDGFHNPAIDALLYPGTGANYSAVTKHFQRH